MKIRTDFIWKMGGQQGEGIESCGEIMAKVLASIGYSLFSQRLFASRIKGGHTTFSLRISGEKIKTIGAGVDNLIALDKETIDLHADELRPNGIIIADARFKPEYTGKREDIILLSLPITETAKECGSLQMKNIVALGMSVALLDIAKDEFVNSIAERFASKTKEVIETNLRSFNEGVRLIEEQRGNLPALEKLPVPPQMEQLFIMGNEAIALGAIVAGSNFMASYPITPASEVMEYMISAMERIKGAVVQTEDELAACMMAMGSSYAGVRGFTATSGPGLSLMAESISMATVAEIPLVIIDVMRAGPSTGMPTKIEQSDIMAAVYSAHGDKGKIVVMADSVEDCFYLTTEAFNLAERYQCPVILLADLQQGLNKQSVPVFDLEKVVIDRGELLRENLPELKLSEYYERFGLTDSGISPRTIPGTANGMFLSTGLEHDYIGKPAEAASMRIEQMNKRLRKFESVADYIEPFFIDDSGEPETDLLIVSTNSVSGAVAEACDSLKSCGKKIKHLRLRLIEPFPTEKMRAYIEKAGCVLIAEHNATAQLASIFKMNLPNGKYQSLLRYDGIPFSAQDICDRVKEVL